MGNRVIFALVSIVFLATSHAAEKKPNQDTAMLKKISSAEWWENCKRYGKLRRAKSSSKEFDLLRDHLLNNNYLNGRDLVGVADRAIEIGMTQCGVIAVMGLPSRINGHTNARSDSDQMVYENNSIRYIYTHRVPGEPLQVVTSFSTRN